MKIINKENIEEYIDYLYGLKYKSDAPKDLIKKWEVLSDEDIVDELATLYSHWNLSEKQIIDYQNGFFEDRKEQLRDKVLIAFIIIGVIMIIFTLVLKSN